MRKLPWWQGSRGEWFVVVQVVLFLIVIFAPRTLPLWPMWSPVLMQLGTGAGFIFLVVGGLFMVAGIFRLGNNLTPLPFPKEEGNLVETGPYAWVRHPIYSGGILVAFGWGFFVHGWLTLVYALILFVFFDIKSRREERWLKKKYPGYASYQMRVRKLIPFIY